MQIPLGTYTCSDEEVEQLLAAPTDDDEICRECGSSEAGSCFYCKMN